MRAGDVTRIGSLAVEVLNTLTLVGDHHAGVVLRISFGVVTFPFTGDAEAPIEVEMLTRYGEARDDSVGKAADVRTVGADPPDRAGGAE